MGMRNRSLPTIPHDLGWGMASHILPLLMDGKLEVVFVFELKSAPRDFFSYQGL